MALCSAGPLLLGACKKSNPVSNLVIQQTPVSALITKTAWLNANTGFFCGGTPGKEGYIYQTLNGGTDWTAVCTLSNSCLFDILFVNDSCGYACGENMQLLKTSNYGKTWQNTGNEINSDNFYNGTLYTLVGNDKLLFAMGGKNFNVGIVTWIKDNSPQAYWTGFKGSDNEFRCATLYNTGNYFAFGYGTAYCLPGKTDTIFPVGVSGDFFTGCCTLSPSERMLCGYDGGIYKLSNYGSTFQKLKTSNRAHKKRLHFNGIAFTSTLSGWVVGNNGVVYKTANGKDFSPVSLGLSDDLLSAVPDKNNRLVISTGKGKLILLNL